MYEVEFMLVETLKNEFKYYDVINHVILDLEYH